MLKGERPAVKIVIAGGKLQGVEAAFLAHEAGIDTVLIDKKSNPPAAGLCRAFFQIDVLKDFSQLVSILEKVDLVIPAFENILALDALCMASKEAKTPIAYDAKSYFMTYSKKRSNRFFKEIGVKTPQSWPDCCLPVILKPSVSSGSRGVSRIDTRKDMDAFFIQAGPERKNWIIEEYLTGPSYSMEVFGLNEQYLTLQVTELGMDSSYDCNRVIAPADITESLDKLIKKIAINIAKNMHLKGIMDVEFIIDREGLPRVLEIDARLPSQTPSTVYKSTGVNMLEIIFDIFVKGHMPVIPEITKPKGVIYEHIEVSQSGVKFPGEHIMSNVDYLEIVTNLFYADLSITNFNKHPFSWVSTNIIIGENRETAFLKRKKVINNIENHLIRYSNY